MKEQDLIPRKEVEKMIQELLEIRRTNRDNSKDHEFWNVCDSQIAALEEVLWKVSQIERVNGGIAVTELTWNIKCFFTDWNEYWVGYKFRDDYRWISFIPTHYMPCPPIINKV